MDTKPELQSYFEMPDGSYFVLYMQGTTKLSFWMTPLGAHLLLGDYIYCNEFFYNQAKEKCSKRWLKKQMPEYLKVYADSIAADCFKIFRLRAFKEFMKAPIEQFA
jgi:hypothetical protein